MPATRAPYRTALLLLGPLAALAAEPSVGPTTEPLGVLAVESPPGPGQELVDLTRALRGAVAEKARHVLPPEELRLRMSAQAGTATLSELDRAFGGAVAAAQAGDYDGAARALRAVVADLETLPETEETFALWSRAMLRLARAEGSLGRKGEAREALERLVRAHPTVVADPELYPPSFVKQVEEVRAELKARPRQRLVVTAGGRPAKVFVEGRLAGVAPVTAQLPRGRYRVTGQLGEVRTSAGVVELGAEDQTAVLDFSVAETLRPAAGPGLALAPAQRAKGLVAAGGLLRLDRLLAASVGTEGDVRYLVGSLYDVRRGMLQREGRLRLNGWAAPAGGLAALTGFLLAGEPSTLVIVDAPAPNTVPAHALAPDPAARSVRASSTKGWMAVGGAVLAVGLGTVAVVEGSISGSRYRQARGMLDASGGLQSGLSPAVYDRLRSEGSQASTMAWVSGGAAVGVAAVSGVLAYLSYQQTGEIGPFRF